MKKLLYSILFLSLVLSGCNKPPQIQVEQDVIFIAAASETGLKVGITDPNTNACDNEIANYALITIQTLNPDGTPTTDSPFNITIDIFYLDGNMYTNTLKLPPGKYNVTAFTLMNNGDDFIAETTDDVIVYATPLDDSNYAELLNNPLPLTFEVGAFRKNEISIEVLCYESIEYESFGFTWFAIDYIVVNDDNNDLAFFGDFCTKFYAQYEANEFYRGQTGDLSHDMVAIFEIEVFKDGVSLGTYNNEEWFGEGQPLFVPNPDDPNKSGEEFKFVLSILVKSGEGFEYKKFYTWTIMDDTFPRSGGNNVMDFVLGSCVPDADLILPPYMNLPATATLETGATIPGTLGTYFDVTLSNFPGNGLGYDIKEEMVGVFCADYITDIDPSTTYVDMTVYSSLYPEFIPQTYNAQIAVLDNINWLGNNLYRYSGHTWKDIQDAVWMMINLSQAPSWTTVHASKMVSDALLYGDNYLPPVGGWAAVLFVGDLDQNENPTVQLLFTLVDP